MRKFFLLRSSIGWETGLFSLLFFATTLHAQVASLTTNLLGRIDSKRVVPGSPFFVKAISEWKQGSCRIRPGDTLEGRVVEVDHQPKREQVRLRFLPLTCAAEESQQIVPMLVALQSPQQISDDSMLNRAALMGAFSSMIGTSHYGGPGGGPGIGATSPSASPAGKAVMGGAGYFQPETFVNQGLRMAEVRGFSGVKLALPTLTSDPTGLLAPRELLLDPGTRFILVVRLIATKESSTNVAVAPPASSPAVSRIAAPPPPPTEEPADLEKCVDSGCALASSPALHADGRLERRLSLDSLGYKTRNHRVLASLADDAAVRFLGEDQLLVTFNAHPLIRRSPQDVDQRSDPRMIRAVLVSAKSGTVLRAEDWRVTTSGSYLWPLSDGRVLAHVGDALLVYGPGMNVERQWVLPGPLASLHVAPSRNLLVAVVLHERHTPDQHRRLAEFIGPERDVDEDYDLTVLDGQLNVVGTKRMDATPEISEVLDSGMLLSEGATRQRWKIREISWNGKQRDITQVRSGCPLRLNTLPTNLILLMGCYGDVPHSYSWYKIVRTDGKTLLTGTTASNDWLENADALTAKGIFAIGIIEASRPIDFRNGMLASDFQKIAVSVYSAANGRRLYAAESPDGAVNRQSFALSGSGDRLAILSGNAVSLHKFTGSPELARAAVQP